MSVRRKHLIPPRSWVRLPLVELSYLDPLCTSDGHLELVRYLELRFAAAVFPSVRSSRSPEDANPIPDRNLRGPAPLSLPTRPPGSTCPAQEPTLLRDFSGKLQTIGLFRRTESSLPQCNPIAHCTAEARRTAWESGVDSKGPSTKELVDLSAESPSQG